MILPDQLKPTSPRVRQDEAPQGGDPIFPGIVDSGAGALGQTLSTATTLPAPEHDSARTRPLATSSPSEASWASGAGQGLKRLGRKHREIIDLHVQGFSRAEISELLGVSRAMVSKTLRDPLAQNEITAALEDYRTELAALQGRAIQTVRDAMHDHQHIDTRLKGVDRFVKLHDTLGIGAKTNETAEDVVQRVLRQINIQVNVGKG